MHTSKVRGRRRQRSGRNKLTRHTRLGKLSSKLRGAWIERFRLNNLKLCFVVNPNTDAFCSRVEVWMTGFGVSASVGVACLPLLFQGTGTGHLMVFATVVLAFLTAPAIAYIQGVTDQGAEARLLKHELTGGGVKLISLLRSLCSSKLSPLNACHCWVY